MTKKVRVRFAPSPTGGLHLGGVRTVLYNYLFARKHDGDFILRIEDTDQTRYVQGAEEYIFDCLRWCALEPDESVEKGGEYGPYRQSERKEIYRQYAQQLVDEGYAYYAFDTKEELEDMRARYKTDQNPNPQYDQDHREHMNNSLLMPKDKLEALLAGGTPHVIRLKVPRNKTVKFTDMVRGDVTFDTNQVDDKVLLKADGMPTYHLAVVVDDYLMKITHAFRGEEWLPSAPIHLLLWKYLGWEDDMPQWAHLPLILKPDGHGKLSKRDGDRLGFPVFAMDWKDPNSGEVHKGFKENGFMPEAFVNMLALLGWSSGTEQEIFSMSELIKEFSLERVHKGGAKFDYEKAKWFNAQYIHHTSDEKLTGLVLPFIKEHGLEPEHDYLQKVVGMVKERCQLLTDFWHQSHFFFRTPDDYTEMDKVKEKWSDAKQNFFIGFAEQLKSLVEWKAESIEEAFNNQVTIAGLKKGDVMLPFRIMLVGGKYGPGVFDIAEMVGKEEVLKRITSNINVR